VVGKSGLPDIVVGHLLAKCLMICVYPPVILLSIRMIDGVGRTGVHHVLTH
jgi:hypothetical protein